MKKLSFACLAALVVLTYICTAFAAPRLQTYIVGSKYYNHYNWLDRYSWVTNSQQFDMKIVGYWAPASPTGTSGSLGSTAAPAAYDYMDCYAAISTPRYQSGTVWINGVEITAFDNYFSALPGGVRPSWFLPLTRPAIFGKFAFEDIGRIDNDQIGAMHYDHGSISTPGWGDEILLNVVVRGFSWTNIRAVGVDSRGYTYTSTPGHDATYFATPEPGTFSLVGIGLLGLVPLILIKKHKQ